MKQMKVVLNFPANIVEDPITYHLIVDYSVQVNILRASIETTPDVCANQVGFRLKRQVGRYGLSCHTAGRQDKNKTCTARTMLEHCVLPPPSTHLRRSILLQIRVPDGSAVLGRV